MTVETSKSTEAKKSKAKEKKLNGVVIGMLSGLNTQGLPLVIFPGNPGEMPVAAKTMATCTPHDIGKEVALLFENGDSHKPLLVGLIQNPTDTIESLQPSQQEQAEVETNDQDNPYLELDGERIELKAKQEITLKCGRASIRLTKAGKILIRGTYLLNRSSGANRIKGGSVQIN
jgi:hypothetical protein